MAKYIIAVTESQMVTYIVDAETPEQAARKFWITGITEKERDTRTVDDAGADESDLAVYDIEDLEFNNPLFEQENRGGLSKEVEGVREIT